MEIYFSFFVQDFRSTIKSQVNLGIASRKEITCSCDMFPSESTLQPITSPPLWVEKHLAADVPPDWGPNHVSMARDAERQQEQMEHHLLIIIIMMAVMILMMMMNIILGNLGNQMTCPQYSSLLNKMAQHSSWSISCSMIETRLSEIHALPDSVTPFNFSAPEGR